MNSRRTDEELTMSEETQKTIAILSVDCLAHLSANHVGKPIETQCFVAGESPKKALPEKIEIKCKECGHEFVFPLVTEGNVNIGLAEALIYFSPPERKHYLEHVGQGFMGSCVTEDGEHKRLTWESKGMVNYRVSYLRDLPFDTEEAEFKTRVSQTVTAHLIGTSLPPDRRVKVRAIPTVDSRNKNIVLIVNKIEPLQTEFSKFSLTAEDKRNFRQHFGDISPYSQTPLVAPSIVGEARKQMKVAVLLVLHSPPSIPDIKGNLIRGTIKANLFGDTMGGKSEALKDVTYMNYGLGDYVAGENASRTGLTYSIIERKEDWTIIWGALVLNDLGLVCIDGLQDISEEEFDKLTEALRLERITVARVIQGFAQARTRVIATMNPRKGHPMKSYQYPCLAIGDSRIVAGEKNITRWDLFVPVLSDDVSNSELAQAEPQKRPVTRDEFIRHVHWAWSRKPENIEYTTEAKKDIETFAEKFMIYFKVEALPLVHNAYREVLCRLAVAWACLVDSTDETHEKVIVRKNDVIESGKYLYSLLQRWKLQEYKNLMVKLGAIEPTELEEMIGDLDPEDLHILRLLSFKPHTSEELGEAIQMCAENVRKYHFAKLSGHKLIETTPGKGAALTDRGKTFVKLLEKGL